MVKNNLKSLLIHIIISFLSIIVFFGFSLSQAKWASEEAAMKHHNYMMFIAITLIVIAIILYYLSGRIFLINQKSIYKNLSASVLPAIIGILIWVIAYQIDFTIKGGHLLNSELWQLYSAFNGYSLFFLDESDTNNYFVFLLFSFLPTIAMAFGTLGRKKLHRVQIPAA